ncbi:hypothetical protein PL18_07150 [Vibrio renipiscarius]|uniref:Uncharacterized protein n=2 Tax=Vibrio renipiscarius TaxID=1461322 RepID=A0A0C2KBM2_9VIBR|nr:hypothetical protein PL18_07150 [Vibrio renipiscarius]KII80933.1 hypothetical protein OJ16_06515 [Vibrio renipiscarius]
MMIVFMSFATIVSYSVMSLNNTVIISSQIYQQSDEMKMIRMFNKKVDTNCGKMELFFCQLVLLVIIIIRYPDSFGFSLRNKDGRNYMYCPYGF